MGIPEIFLEHKRGDKVQKYLRLTPERQMFLIGSSSEADLRITGSGVTGCHAVLRYRAPHWYVCDVSGTESLNVNDEVVSESRIDRSAKIAIGDHQIQLFSKERNNELFAESSESSGLSLHQVVVRRKGAIVETHLLDAKKSFKYVYGDEKVLLPAPSTGAWVTHTYGVRTIQQRLVAAQEVVVPDKFTFDRDLRRSLIASFVILFVLLSSVWIANRGRSEKAQVVLDKVSMDMIFDSKTIKKKREESKKVVRQKSIRQSAPTAVAETQVSEASAPVEATAPKTTNSKATAALTSLRKSGLSSLIGKIAKRASKQASMIASTGVSAEKVGSGGAFSAGTVLDAGGGHAVKDAPNFRLGGVGTQGHAGGVANGKLRSGSKLAAGSVGTGNVVALSNDEETVVEGGLDKDAIADVIRRNLGQIRYCYERQLSSNPDLYGKVLVRFTIGASGDVGEPRVDNSTLKSAMVEGCILRRLAGWKFPLPKGGTQVRVSYPFLFKALD